MPDVSDPSPSFLRAAAHALRMTMPGLVVKFHHHAREASPQANSRGVMNHARTNFCRRCCILQQRVSQEALEDVADEIR